MYIFIDESGIFSRTENSTANVSIVGALVVPDHLYNKLCKDVIELKKSWGYDENTEIKGRNLDEIQIDNLIKMMLPYPIIYEPIILDLNLNTKDEYAQFQRIQASRMTSRLTKSHSAKTKNEAYLMQEEYSALSPQLAVQMFVTWHLFYAVIRSSYLYYPFTAPSTMSSCIWYIDRKNPTSTKYEQILIERSGRILQSYSYAHRLDLHRAGDYSYAKHFFIEIDKYPEAIRRKIIAGERFADIDFGRLVKEYYPADSSINIGLQLVDVLVNAMRRSVVGNLKQSGWKHIGGLVAALPGEQKIERLYLGLGHGEGEVSSENDKTMINVIKKIRKMVKPLVPLEYL